MKTKSKNIWSVRDSSYGGIAEIEAETAHEAMVEFAEACRDGKETETFWVDCTAVDGDGNEFDEKVAVDPVEPKCPSEDGQHEWEDLGAWGHGGGVILKFKCAKCGLRRDEDGWAQNGGEQGLDSVTYSEIP